MTRTHQEHIFYTRVEYDHLDYYQRVIEKLNGAKIERYIDLGANTGEVCKIFMEKIPSLKGAYLFEPEAKNYSFMRQNIDEHLSRHPDNWATYYDIAIIYGFENPILEQWGDGCGGFHVIENKDYQGTNNLHPISRFNTLEAFDFKDVDMVKIDIEGLEYNVIENSSYLQEIPWIEIEFHRWSDIPSIYYVIDKFPKHRIAVFEDPNKSKEYYSNRVLLERLK